MTTTQTMRQALHLINREIGDIRFCGTVLTGCPSGDCGETDQALAQFRELLPLRSQRDYTDDALIDALYTVDGASRYQRR